MKPVSSAVFLAAAMLTLAACAAEDESGEPTDDATYRALVRGPEWRVPPRRRVPRKWAGDEVPELRDVKPD
jgi:hypothetical protein